MIETWIFVTALISTATGGAVGTSIVALYLSRQFALRERMLSDEIEELRARVDELQRIVNRVIQQGGVNVTAQDGSSITVGQDVTGRDKHGTRPLS